MRTLFVMGTLLAVGAGSARASPCETAFCQGQPETTPRFGVGFHHTSQAIGTEDDHTRLGGGGLHLRVRVMPRWSVELGLDHLQSEAGDEAQSRSLSVAFHPLPARRLDLYLLAGAGKEDDRAEAHVGAGLEKRFRHLGIGVEVRALAFRSQDEAAPMQLRSVSTTPPATGDGDTRQHGAQVTLGLTWYFGRH